MRFALAFLALASSASEPGQITFHRDVEPIFQRRCQTCHRPGEIGPMSLLTYRQVRPWAKAILESVLLRRMPPWHAEPGHLTFRNDLSLTGQEIQTIQTWVRQGAPKGDERHAPPKQPFASGWRIDTPDVVLEMPMKIRVPAGGEIDYIYLDVPTGFTEDKWVEMAEVRPSNRSVVHHAIVTIRSPEGGYLAGYAPGMSPQIWPSGTARLVPAGAILQFQLHYNAAGREATDRTRIGLRFARTPPSRRVVSMRASSPGLVIPPRAADHPAEAATVIRRDVELLGFRPHMHLRGKSFEYRALPPDGRELQLLRVPRYDFNWQPFYYLDQPILLPASTRILCRATFDNSPNNRHNPNPDSYVYWGEQSWEEMMIGYFEVAVPVEASHKPLD
ncbi:MAG: thiol-disulfide isomerase [Acidimicrobiia bacterium]|nr:thiol-disulfide isomerase [Acidimicrobiia bacterium]